MLDENLPTFYFRQPSDNPLSTNLYFTQNGSEPVAEYTLQRLDPTLPQARNKYAIALGDASAHGVIFAEVLIEPEFQQPSLSAAEIRARNGAPTTPVPIIPESFTVQLYNPDQQVVIRGEKSTWMGKESFEFEIPQQTFRTPSASQIDRQQNNPVTNSLTPKIMFKWKRESKFSKDMTCYMTGRSVGGKKSKEPDITVALYQHGREKAVTIYEPNLQRVEVEDRKGLEIVLLLGAEVIREIYLTPSRDSFNVGGVPANKRKNSKPLGNSPGSPKPDAYTMTSGIGVSVPAAVNSPAAQQPTQPPTNSLDDREREKRDKAEQKRIKKMLEDEERERRKRDAEVEKETERLRKEFGMEGQDFGPRPNLPPRPGPSGSTGPSRPALHLQTPAPPPRPLSAGPRPTGHSSWFSGPAMGPGMPPQPAFYGPPQPQPKPGRRRGGSGDGKIHKKKSTFF
ncbi:hypothetical protein F5B22DRAFT_586321 [Xylaria bambusicola]|uniref:uncharacterized protein n=1 Tax=Xylaria bambusicola TaxID=326684 RepID=UPI002008C152|nr:uncharacterized protein F5B22DRAFT_586321 [Xylaria bambusicola]KAI0526528.1 hypothetical protein F5B22DRAFT_586321 [Xylaria bambusicola]